MKKYKYQLNFKDIGLQDKRVKIFPEDEQRMKELRKQGLSYGKIAGIMGLTYANVYMHLNKEYYDSFKKYLRNYTKCYYQRNKEKIAIRTKVYREKRKQILSSIDTSKYLIKREPKLTVKRKIMNFLQIGKEYTYKQIKDMLDKDYGLFSGKLKELEADGFIIIAGKIGKKTIKRIK